MRLVAKTVGKVVLEITTKEIELNGFDSLWDKIRKIYKTKEYKIDSIYKSSDNDELIFIELISNRIKK